MFQRRTAYVPTLIGCLTLLLLVSIINRAHRMGPLATEDRERLIEPIERVEGSGATKKFLTVIRRPAGAPRIDVEQPDPQGRQGSIACSTCHSVREPNFQNRRSVDLDQFHQNIPIEHGSLSCYSCHNPNDADSLRLADSSSVNFQDVMSLCAQCHGAQFRDYQHGAHGGMNGYWDLSRGPRTRNNCIDCHDPHVPKFPSMKPTFKPRDRFLESPGLHVGNSQVEPNAEPEVAHE